MLFVNYIMKALIGQAGRLIGRFVGELRVVFPVGAGNYFLTPDISDNRNRYGDSWRRSACFIKLGLRVWASYTLQIHKVRTFIFDIHSETWVEMNRRSVYTGDMVVDRYFSDWLSDPINQEKNTFDVFVKDGCSLEIKLARICSLSSSLDHAYRVGNKNKTYVDTLVILEVNTKVVGMLVCVPEDWDAPSVLVGEIFDGDPNDDDLMLNYATGYRANFDQQRGSGSFVLWRRVH